MSAAKAKPKKKAVGKAKGKKAKKPPVPKKTVKPARKKAAGKPKPAAKSKVQKPVRKTPAAKPQKPGLKVLSPEKPRETAPPTPVPKKPPTQPAPPPAPAPVEQPAEPEHNPYGASDEAVEDTTELLGVVFPRNVIRIWKALNGAGINDWKFHALRDPANPTADRRDIIHINTDARPEDFPDDFISIAEQDGNHLVLQREDDRLLPELFVWDHDTADVAEYDEDLANFVEEAEEIRDELLRRRRR